MGLRNDFHHNETRLRIESLVAYYSRQQGDYTAFLAELHRQLAKLPPAPLTTAPRRSQDALSPQLHSASERAASASLPAPPAQR